jgi:hypothetical protein
MERYVLKKNYNPLKKGAVLLNRYNDGYLYYAGADIFFNMIYEPSPNPEYFQMLKNTAEDIVWEEIIKLSQATNRFTTLEVKLSLRERFPDEFWDQQIVKKCFDHFVSQGGLIFENGETFRVYSVNHTKQLRIMSKINATTATSLSPSALVSKIEENKGKLTTIKFIKDSNNEERVANGIYVGRTTLGNIQFQEYKHMKTKKSGLVDAYLSAKKTNKLDDFTKQWGKNAVKKAEEYHEYTQILPKNILEVRVAGCAFVSNKKKSK